jgi:4a-hydroxytetrahydrobiopterin dehydratase
LTKKLTKSEIAEELKSLNFWEINDEKLYRKIKFKNFVSAFSFMTNIAIHAEKENHHPEWKNVYDQVEIWLTTHDAKGITKKDISLAKIINEYSLRNQI